MTKIAIIINVIFGLLILGTQIWMNIKLKFAKTQEEAMIHAKNVIINLVFVVLSFGFSFLLGNELGTASFPLDRLSFLRILLLSFLLASSYFFWVVMGIMSIIKDLLKLFKLHYDAYKLHMDECHDCNECKKKKHAQQKHPADLC
jgi:hypothetical protein